MSGVCSVLAPSRICSYTVGLRARSVKHVALSSVSGTNETVGWLEERFVYLEICLLRECFQLWPDVASGLQTASSLHISRIYWPSRTGVRQIINHGMSSAHVRLDGVSCPHPLARGARRRPGNASLPAPPLAVCLGVGRQAPCSFCACVVFVRLTCRVFRRCVICFADHSRDTFARQTCVNPYSVELGVFLLQRGRSFLVFFFLLLYLYFFLKGV